MSHQLESIVSLLKSSEFDNALLVIITLGTLSWSTFQTASRFMSRRYSIVFGSIAFFVSSIVIFENWDGVYSYFFPSSGYYVTSPNCDYLVYYAETASYSCRMYVGTLETTSLNEKTLSNWIGLSKECTNNEVAFFGSIKSDSGKVPVASRDALAKLFDIAKVYANSVIGHDQAEVNKIMLDPVADPQDRFDGAIEAFRESCKVWVSQ